MKSDEEIWGRMNKMPWGIGIKSQMEHSNCGKKLRKKLMKYILFKYYPSLIMKENPISPRWGDLTVANMLAQIKLFSQRLGDELERYYNKYVGTETQQEIVDIIADELSNVKSKQS